jgi:hypothetical protein
MNDLREKWLNPAELVVSEPEWRRDFPNGGSKNATAGKGLSRRTLTNLYNDQLEWLVDAHAALDFAVASAYECGSEGLNDDEVLACLFKLNIQRVPKQRR